NILRKLKPRPLARRARPHEGAFGRMKAVHGAGTAAMHELLVVMQIEAIEIGALAPFDLLDPPDLAFQQCDRLAGAGLDDEFGDDLTRCHRTLSAAASALCAAAYLRSASRTRETRSGATPCAMVRSISSSCCWFNRNLTTVSAMGIPLEGNRDGQIPYTGFVHPMRFWSDAGRPAWTRNRRGRLARYRLF